VIEKARVLWASAIKWPMPLWRLRGRASFQIGGERLVFCDVARPPADWWAWLARAGDYERPVIEFLVDTIRPGDVFFDVGAFNGMYSMLAARRGARVVAFEPDSRAHALARRNIALNGLAGEVVRCAVGARAGLTHLAPAHAGRLSSHVADHGDEHVRVITLDEFCAERGLWPDVLKMDIEGGERDALAGATSVLARLRAAAIEAHGSEEVPPGLMPAHFAARVLERRWGNVNVAYTAASDGGPGFAA
jgi:FkbM family methyltransferase